jgi:hypothetical protein
VSRHPPEDLALFIAGIARRALRAADASRPLRPPIARANYDVVTAMSAFAHFAGTETDDRRRLTQLGSRTPEDAVPKPDPQSGRRIRTGGGCWASSHLLQPDARAFSSAFIANELTTMTGLP